MELIREYIPLTPEEVRELYITYEREHADLWKRCYPRIYTGYGETADYYTPKRIAHQLMGSIRRVEAGYFGECEQVELIWASSLIEKNVPTFWISRDMAMAVRETVPPFEIDWVNMKMPFESAVFMLPKGILTHKNPKEGDVSFISYFRSATKETKVISAARHDDRVIPSPHSLTADENMIFLARTEQGGQLMHWNFPYRHFPVLNMGQLDDYLQQFKDLHNKSDWHFEKMTPDDTQIMAQTALMVMGILLLMTRRPDLITHGKLLKRVAPKHPTDHAREFWSPNVVGEHYRIKREMNSLGGTHASPRWHWVRGFWKDQHYGPKHSLVKEIWIEPYTRG